MKMKMILNSSFFLNYTTDEISKEIVKPAFDKEAFIFVANLWKISFGYILTPLVILGVIGNCLSVVVLCSRSLRYSNTAVYLRTLAVTDILVLITAMLRFKSYKLFMSDQKAMESAIRIDPYIEHYGEPFHYMAMGASSFVTVLLSLERYLAVKYPLVIKRSCSVLLVRICITGAFAIVITLTVPNFFSYEIVKTHFMNFTIFSQKATEFGINTKYPCVYHRYITPIGWYLIPWSILASLNILLGMQVRKSSRIRAGNSFMRSQNKHLTILIFCLVIVYVICNFPKCVTLLVRLQDVEMSKLQNCMRDTDDFSMSRSYLVADTVASLLNVINSCTNIIIYGIVGKKFRQELKKVLTCNSCKRNNKVHILPNSHVTEGENVLTSLPN